MQAPSRHNGLPARALRLEIGRALLPSRRPVANRQLPPSSDLSMAFWHSPRVRALLRRLSLTPPCFCDDSQVEFAANMTEYSYDPEERFAVLGAHSEHDEMGAEPTCSSFVRGFRKEATKQPEANDATGSTELSWDPTRRFNALAWATKSPRAFHTQQLRSRPAPPASSRRHPPVTISLWSRPLSCFPPHSARRFQDY